MIEEIKLIIEGGENISTEFKEAKTGCPKSAYETVCAFLNRIGGDLLFGVADNGEIVGINKDFKEQIKKDFVTSINNVQILSPVHYLTVNEYEVDGKIILHIKVPEGSEVYRCKGKIYDRNEDGDIDVTHNAYVVTNMYIRKRKEYSENEVYTNVKMDDFSVETIEKVKRIAGLHNPQHPWREMTHEELFGNLELIQIDERSGKEGFTLAAILLFGKENAVLRAVPHHRTDAILRRVDVDRYDDRDFITCNLIESFDRLMTFVFKHFNDKFYLEGVTRVDLRDKLFREVIVNMLIHREYLDPHPARFVIEKDFVRTENANKAHGYGEIDKEHSVSFAKNPTIAKVFREIKLAEELGSGIRNTKKYCEIYYGTEPTFTEGDIFITVIPTIKTVDNNQKQPIKTADNNQKQPIKTADNNQKLLEVIAKTRKTAEQFERIIEYILENEKITNLEVCEILGVSPRRGRTIISQLTENNVIVAHGANRNRYYTLK